MAMEQFFARVFYRQRKGIDMYSFTSRIRYSEVDSSLTLTYPSIINYFQDCSTFQSEDLGIGVAFLKEQHRAWLVTAWQLEIRRLPVLGEPVTVSTWPYEFKGMFGKRNFLLSDEAGTTLVAANSVWVHADTDTGHPIKISPEQEARYRTEPPFAMEYAPRKIIVPKELVFEKRDAIFVTDSLLDSNHHVNNGQYISIAASHLTERKVSGLRAVYKKQARLGDSIYPCIATQEDTTYIFLCDEAGDPYAITEFTHHCAERKNV